MSDVLEENERLRARLALTERERDSLRKSIQNLRDYVIEQNCEIELLRSENPQTRRIASEFLRRPYCGQNCADAKNDAIGPQSAAKTTTTKPRNGALSDGLDPDSRVWETPCTPHATPTHGSVPGEGSFPDSRKEKEPAAWLVIGDDYEYATLLAEHAGAVAEEEGGTVVPLYRHRQPMLTDEERWAAKAAWKLACRGGPLWEYANTFRKLLERLGGER